MTVDVPVEAQTAGAGQRPGELGEGDHQISDADVGAQVTGRTGPFRELLDGAGEAVAGGGQVRVVLVEGGVEHRAQGADPLLCGGVHERPQRAERGRLAGFLGGEPRSACSVMVSVTVMTTWCISSPRSLKFRYSVALPTAGAACDLVERQDGTVLHEQFARGVDDPLPVAHRVGPRAGARRCVFWVAVVTAASFTGRGARASASDEVGSCSPFRADTGLNGETVPGYFPPFV